MSSAFARLSELRRDRAEAASGRGGGSPAASTPSLVPARETLDPKYTWDLTSIFASWDSWEQAFTELDRGVEVYKKYRGTLGQGGDQLLKALAETLARKKVVQRITPELGELSKLL